MKYIFSIFVITFLFSCGDDSSDKANVTTPTNNSTTPKTPTKPASTTPKTPPKMVTMEEKQMATTCVGGDPDFFCSKDSTGSNCSNDPDCTDTCVLEKKYTNGVCDTDCAMPDAACNATTADPCWGTTEDGTVYSWYSDRECDTSCLVPDPDCSDICVQNGWYYDNVCDENLCSQEDPDCSGGDSCEALGYYNDGTCDAFCDADPDCLEDNEVGVLCVMPAHNGVESKAVYGSCISDSIECGDGIVFNGDATCSSSGTVCCIPAENIQAVIDETFRPNGDPSLCGQEGGFCVDQTEQGACDIDGRALESGLCSGSADVFCCK